MPLRISQEGIAVGTDGVVHIVWCTEGTPSNEVHYVRSTDQGATFSAPVEVHDGYYGYKPSIAVDPNDPMVLFVAYVGYQNEGEVRSIRVSKSSDGGLTWAASVPIFGSVTDCNNPAIAVDSKGNPHVAFDNYTDSFTRYNYSLDGGVTFQPEPEIMSIGFADDTFSAEIVIDKEDNIHIFTGGGGTTGSWGDKGVYWTWRTWGAGGFVQEVPPRELSAPGTGLPYPSGVVTSDNHIHLWYDNAGANGEQRGVWYTEYDGSSWSEATAISSINEGASTCAPSASVDANDNLYLIYLDCLEGGTDLTVFQGDLISGTNADGGEWQYVNLTANGRDAAETHANTAYSVVSDSLLHIVYTTGAAAPYNIVHEVGYPWPPEPTCGVNQLSDTYNTVGPFKIAAGTGDIDGVVVGCQLHVLKNDVEIEVIDMTELDQDSYEAEFSVEGAIGDKISYFGEAVDNDNNIGQSITMSFMITEPANPNVDMLIVRDDTRLIDLFWTPLLDCVKTADAEKYNFEIWDVDEHKGIDASITTFGWKTIFVAGWSIGSVPIRGYEGDAYAAFLQAGTEETPANLALASMDWPFGQGESDLDLTFEPGEFAYDFFQIAAMTNDPRETVGEDDVAPDSVLLGNPDDPISGSFADIPLELRHDLTVEELTGEDDVAQWIDYSSAVDPANDIFILYNLGYTSGTKYDGGTFKTVMLPWMMCHLVKLADPEAGDSTVVPQDEAFVLMENILHWFGTDAGEGGVSVEDGPSTVATDFALKQNYPNPFNPATQINYSVPTTGQVEILVYNALGQKIRSLVNEKVSAGHHTVKWDGTNEYGTAVSSGMYFYKIKAENFSKTMKMMLLK